MILALAALSGLSACGGGPAGGAGGGKEPVGSAKFQEAIDPNLVASARQAEATFDYETAANQYQALLNRNPGDRNYTIALSRNLRYVGRNSDAVALLSDWLGKHQPDGKVLLELGKAYLASDRLGLAEKTLRQSLDKDANNWDAYSSLGVVMDYQGNHADAQAQYLEALKIAPDNPTVLNNLGLSRAQAGDLPGAIEALRRAADQPSAGVQVRQNLAMVLAINGDLEGAERLTRKDLTPEQIRKNMTYFRHLSGRD